MLARFAEGLQFEAIGTNVRVSVVYPSLSTHQPSPFGVGGVQLNRPSLINMENLASKIIDGVTEGKKEILITKATDNASLRFFQKALFSASKNRLIQKKRAKMKSTYSIWPLEFQALL